MLRVKADTDLPVLRVLADGSWISRIADPDAARRLRRKGLRGADMAPRATCGMCGRRWAAPLMRRRSPRLLDLRVDLTHKQIFERYMYAGAISQNPDAIAAMFTEDGVYDAPLVPDDHPLRYLVGRDAIRTGTSVYHQRLAHPGTMNLERSAYVLHDTADPDVFMAEIDVAFDEADGRRTTMSLLQIFRLRDGQIAKLRDYFSEMPSVVSDARSG